MHPMHETHAWLSGDTADPQSEWAARVDCGKAVPVADHERPRKRWGAAQLVKCMPSTRESLGSMLSTA